LRIVFAGTTDNAVEVLRYLVEQANHEVVAVLTRDDARIGRKQQITPSPVAEYSTSVSLPIIRANIVDGAIDMKIAEFDADLGIVVAYGALLKRRTLEIPKNGWINVHYSLLPSLRGAAPAQRALIEGMRETGVSIFQLDEGMDTGPIHAQVQTIIEPGESAGELLSRLTKISITMLDECLAKISSGFATPQPQQGEATLAKKLSRADARIDIKDSAVQIENLIRGCNPEPMAWLDFRGEPLRVITAVAAARPASDYVAAEVGEVVEIEGSIFVKTGSGLLKLIDVQPASKRVMRAEDWHRGINSRAVLS
jgi:methionyl-tRNA formyltransferase